MVSILDLMMILPLLGVFAILAGAPARGTALVAAVANLVAALVLFLRFDRTAGPGVMQFAVRRPILEAPEISLAFGVDGMSLLLVLLTCLVTVAAVVMSPAAAEARGQHRFYWVCSLLISAGALGAFVSTDLFFLYAFHELALIPTFLMIGKLGHGEDRVDVAWRVTLYLGLGSLVLLAGLLALVNALGGSTFDVKALTDLARAGGIPAETQRWLVLLLLIGFGSLISLFPFHSWAAPGYAAAPVPVAMLHAGVLKKFGLYGLIRIVLPMLPEGLHMWSHWIMVLLLGNILYIGLIAVSQDRLDRMLGYASVMHMGYIFLGIISLNQIGLSGAVLLMFAHGLSTAVLFGLCGEMRTRYPSLDMRFIGGQAMKAPVLCFTFGLAAFASIGLPGFANFASELMVFFGAFRTFTGGAWGWFEWTTALALWGVVISAVYMLRAVRNLFHGANPGQHELGELPGRCVMPAAMLLSVLVAVGVSPSLLLDLIPGSLKWIVGQS